jgi:hypothetical protein
VISKYLSMNLKQKAAVSLLIDTILEKARWHQSKKNSN